MAACKLCRVSYNCLWCSFSATMNHTTLVLMETSIFFFLFCKDLGGGVLGDIATATTYDPPYSPTRCYGNREDQFPPGNLFVAVGEGLWDNGAACGRRYRLKCLSGNGKPCKAGYVDVRVVDFCPRRPCPSTILMTPDAFAAISQSPSSKINVEYIQI